MKTAKTDTFNQTKAQRDALPATFGHPVMCDYVERHHAERKAQETVYDLDFDAITYELEIALNIGLENYGSGRASYEICRILKGNNNMNKIASLWQLYCSEVANQHERYAINKHWKAYTEEQRATVTQALTEYAAGCIDYLTTEFGE